MKLSVLRSLTVAIVGCGKAKAAAAAPARALYTGSLFRAARTYAETRCDAWCIASARHGLIAPELVVAPYEHRLASKEAAFWGHRVADEFLRAFAGVGPIDVVLLCGGDYAHAIRYGLRDHRRDDGYLGAIVRVTEPLAGMGIGHRLAWLKCATSESNG